MVNKEQTMNKNKWQVIVGVLWLILGLWALTYQIWLGVGMCVLGIAYLAYAVPRAVARR